MRAASADLSAQKFETEKTEAGRTEAGRGKTPKGKETQKTKKASNEVSKRYYSYY